MEKTARRMFMILVTALICGFLMGRAFGEMSSVVHGYSTTTLVESFTTSQRVLFNGVPNHVPHYRDYFGLFAAGSETRLQWCYIDGTKTVIPTRALISGTCIFEGLKPGNYAVRVYAAGGTQLLDSAIFTIEPQWLEYRTIAEDGTVTFERIKESATTDRVLIKRSTNFNVDIHRMPSAITVRQRGSNAAATVIPTLKAAPTVAPRANP